MSSLIKNAMKRRNVHASFFPAAATSSSPPVRGGSSKLQESSDFLSQLSNADSFKRKPRMAHQAKASPAGKTSITLILSAPGIEAVFTFSVLFSEDRRPLVEVKISSSFRPLESASEPSDPSHSRTAPPCRPTTAPQPPVPKDVDVEKYSGLRLRSDPVGMLMVRVAVENFSLNRFFFFFTR